MCIRDRVRTADGKASAHFEHTVAATVAGPVVLGFGRFTADGARTGAPAFSEYPPALLARGGRPAEPAAARA